MQQLPPASKIAIVSDLHLGRGDGQTGFYGTPEQARALLRAIAKTADLTIINGDLYDLDRGSLPTAQKREYEFLRPKWASVEACIEEYGIRLTAGNHDRALLGQIVGGAPVFESYVVSVGARIVRIEHGERFDAWIKRNRRFTSFATWWSGWFSRHQLHGLYRLLRRIEAFSTKDQEGGHIRRARRWMSEQKQCDILVLGHTHARCATACEKGWLLNPGDAMHPVANYLLIDAAQLKVTFFTIDQNLVSTPVHHLAL